MMNSKIKRDWRSIRIKSNKETHTKESHSDAVCRQLAEASRLLMRCRGTSPLPRVPPVEWSR